MDLKEKIEVTDLPFTDQERDTLLVVMAEMLFDVAQAMESIASSLKIILSAKYSNNQGGSA